MDNATNHASLHNAILAQVARRYKAKMEVATMNPVNHVSDYLDNSMFQFDKNVNKNNFDTSKLKLIDD
eukprot:6338477-Amphidinium_carterae.1